MIRKIALVILLVFVGIQFIPTLRNQNMEVLPTHFTKLYKVPEPIENSLKTSCYDCHSNNTNYLWYDKIQPMAWIVEDHIIEGKKELNFSEFGSYSIRRQKSKLKSIINQIKEDEMPLSSYLLFHRNAKLSEGEKTQMVAWFESVLESNNFIN